MKKIVLNIILLFIFFVLYFLQTNFFNWFNIAGVKPNLFVLYVLFIGLFAGKRPGIIYGVIIGLLLDLLTSQSLGATSIMFGIIGFLGGYFDKNFSKENRLTIMGMGIGACFLFEIGVYVVNSSILTYPIEILEFLKILSIELLFNTLLTIIIYPIFQKAGYKIEEIYKNRNAALLTRYF